MAAKLPIPKFDATAIGEIRAKFSAWWNGNDYNNAPNNTELDNRGSDNIGVDSGNAEINRTKPMIVKASKNDAKANNQDELLNYLAIESLFGEGRICPTNEEFDLMTVAEFNLPPKNDSAHAKLYCFGVDSGARFMSYMKNYNVDIEAFEENQTLKTKANEYIAKQNIKPFPIHKFDKSPKSVPKNKAQLVFIFSQGTSLEKLEGVCFALSRILAPNGKAIWIDYFVKDGEQGFYKNEQANIGRSFVFEGEISPILDAAGLKLVDSEDVGAHILNSYYEKQELLAKNWDNIQAELIKRGGINVANHALATALTWKKRITAIRKGQLIMKKLLISAN